MSRARAENMAANESGNRGDGEDRWAATRLPVAVLENNIVAEFEKVADANAHSLRHAVDRKVVSPKFDYLLDHVPPQAPRAYLEQRYWT